MAGWDKLDDAGWNTNVSGSRKAGVAQHQFVANNMRGWVARERCRSL
jgi:hypothetical protein